MKSQIIRKLVAIVVACTLPALAQAQDVNPAIPPSLVTPGKVETPLGTLEFKDGAPSEEAVTKVYDYLDLMHGVEAFVNAYQGASTMACVKGFKAAGIPNNEGNRCVLVSLNVFLATAVEDLPGASGSIGSG